MAPVSCGAAFRPWPPIATIVGSPLLRHLSAIHITNACRRTPRNNASLSLLAQHAPNLTSLWCALRDERKGKRDGVDWSERWIAESLTHVRLVCLSDSCPPVPSAAIGCQHRTMSSAQSSASQRGVLPSFDPAAVNAQQASILPQIQHSPPKPRSQKRGSAATSVMSSLARANTLMRSGTLTQSLSLSRGEQDAAAVGSAVGLGHASLLSQVSSPSHSGALSQSPLMLQLHPSARRRCPLIPHLRSNPSHWLPQRSVVKQSNAP